MVNKIIHYSFFILHISIVFILLSCAESPTDVQKVNEQPKIYPDYIGVTIPVGIAPMNFDVDADNVECLDVIVKGSKGGELHSNGKVMELDIDDWHSLVERNRGGKLSFTLCVKQNGAWKQYDDFEMMVSDYALDEWGLTYRRVAPGYEVFGEMGLYQRDLSNFDEYEIIANTRIPGMCVNCHTSNRTNPKEFLFHVRGEHPVTALQKSGKRQMLSTKTDETLGLCVYPYWHPEGRYIAFSTNTTRQGFHVVKDERIEVFDFESDLQILDTETNELILSPLVKGDSIWETFPAFSADGKTLYFCSATPRQYPLEFKETRYNLCSIGFDAQNGRWGEKVDTVINAVVDSMSVTLPRPSYDGKWLMYTRSSYGTFPIWHKEADLWLLNLKTDESRPLTEVNSDDTESFHNWNVNSHWFVFSSRRGDGLYTRLYLSSIDDEGKATKPFLLPQKNPKHYYERMMQSYNTPDFTSEKVDFDSRSAANEILQQKSTSLSSRLGQ